MACFDVLVNPDPALYPPRRGAVATDAYFVGTPTHVDELGTAWCLPPLNRPETKAPRGCMCHECGSIMPLRESSELTWCPAASTPGTCNENSQWSQSQCFFSGIANDVDANGNDICTCEAPQCICKRPSSIDPCADCDVCAPPTTGDLSPAYCKVSRRLKNGRVESDFFSSNTVRNEENVAEYENYIEAFMAESVPPNSKACQTVTVYDEDEGCGNSKGAVSYHGDFSARMPRVTHPRSRLAALATTLASPSRLPAHIDTATVPSTNRVR